MKKTKYIGIALAFSLLSSMSINANVQSVNISPLSDKLNVKSEEVKNDQQLPQILWGADMLTIYANGLKTKTANGSFYNKSGLNFDLNLTNSVVEQSEAYISGKTPFFRGTLDQVALLNDAVYNQPNLRPVVLQQLSWSKGGDNLVVKPTIKNLSDLKGKTVAIMAYGPHMYFLHRVLTSAGLKPSDVNIVWVKNLDGDNSPFSAFYENKIDAAFMITPDALSVTEGDSAVSGARILFSTVEADKFVADVYAVRSDYYEQNKDKLQNFVHASFLAAEELESLVKNKLTRKDEFNKWLEVSSQQLMGSQDLIEDVYALYTEADHTGFSKNLSFFTNERDARNFKRLSEEVNLALKEMNLVKNTNPIMAATWDWTALSKGLKNVDKAEIPKFNQQQVSKLVTEMQMSGTLDDEQFLSQQVYFEVGDASFVYNPSLHKEIFDKIVNEATAYSGALIIVEGHSDPAHYIISKYRDQAPTVTLKRIRQMARDLSRQRAEEVRKAIIEYANDVRGLDINATQFEVVGYGIDKPETGLCNGEPCKLDLKGQAAVNAYAKNRRAKIGFIRISAEVDVSASDFDF